MKTGEHVPHLLPPLPLGPYMGLVIACFRTGTALPLTVLGPGRATPAALFARGSRRRGRNRRRLGRFCYRRLAVMGVRTWGLIIRDVHFGVDDVPFAVPAVVVRIREAPRLAPPQETLIVASSFGHS